MHWDLSTNPFETLTRRRFTAMDSIISDHVAKCSEQLAKFPADPDLKLVHQRALAARTGWNVAYVQWSVSRRTHMGRTFALSQLVTELRRRQISLWQVMIQRTDLEHSAWLKGSAGFDSLFPSGRRPFQQGGTESRIAAVARLSASLSEIGPLADVHQAVRAFHLTLTTARTLQQEVRASMSRTSTVLEKQRKDAAAILYRNMARLMEKHAEAPAAIWNFFDRNLFSKSPARASVKK